MKLPNGIKPKYGIFTTNREFANDTIDSYVRSHNCPILKRVQSQYESLAIMQDGTEYKWIKPTLMSRGNRCSVGVIDLATCELEFIKNFISAICIFAEKENYVFVDSAFTLEEDKNTYDLHTLIDRLQKIESILGNVKKVGFSDFEYGWQRVAFLSVSKDDITFDTDC